VLITLIEAASNSTLFGDNFAVADREVAEDLARNAREFLMAWWSRKKPTLEMPPAFGRPLDAP
jgi:hypothetical protein